MCMSAMLPFLVLLVHPLPAQDRCDSAGDNTVQQVRQALDALEQATPAEPATQVTAADLANADALRATCYDDGDVCPGGCDAHVLTNRADNGSARVHAPGSQAGDWQS